MKGGVVWQNKKRKYLTVFCFYEVLFVGKGLDAGQKPKRHLEILFLIQFLCVRDQSEFSCT